MSEETERLAWLESQGRKKSEFMRWMLRAYKMQLHIDEIESANKEINKEKEHRTSFTNTHLDTKKKILKEKETNAWRAIEFNIKYFPAKEFNRLKSRWSSYLNRKSLKSIGCSISQEAHEKLMELKGKHKLRDTVEIMISLTHSRQTETSLTNIIKPKTTPLLDTFPTQENAESKLPPSAIDALISAQSDIGSLQKIISKQSASIEALLKRINSLEKHRSNT
ncbi:hypothetical protein [Aquipseudomonas alcaligenes]|uniref:hypothetical protein n=1 Tax=Aquipseudomonas alcaligenes TaxID=43263 RepID=UPI000B321013|nr:hypothetical protein [Pseudomonas alcaligenes]